jgi:hypothetical protein
VEAVESDLSGRRGLTIVARLVLMGVAGLVSVAIIEEQSATTDLMSRNVGNVSAAGANPTRQSAERVSTAAGEIQTLIGDFRY